MLVFISIEKILNEALGADTWTIRVLRMMRNIGWNNLTQSHAMPLKPGTIKNWNDAILSHAMSLKLGTVKNQYSQKCSSWSWEKYLLEKRKNLTMENTVGEVTKLWLYMICQILNPTGTCRGDDLLYSNLSWKRTAEKNKHKKLFRLCDESNL